MTRYGRRWRAWLAGLCLGALPGLALAGGPFPTTYDREIKEAWNRYHPGRDWLLWKSQLYQESKLNPAARSPVGAEGLAQFMPSTWAEITKVMGLGVVDRRMVEPSIRAGAFYMARLAHGWRSPRPDSDRMKLAQASYNAGAGSLIRAQKKCGGPPLYADIVRCLPQVTGRYSAETITYVERIERWRRMMAL